jgi:hypothetical protein
MLSQWHAGATSEILTIFERQSKGRDAAGKYRSALEDRYVGGRRSKRAVWCARDCIGRVALRALARCATHNRQALCASWDAGESR